VVGGLAFSQVVTLFLTPVFYIYMEQAKGWTSRVFGKRHDVTPEPAPSSHGPLPGGTLGAPIARISGAALPAPKSSTASPTDPLGHPAGKDVAGL
jgi:hypothetical protein